MDRLKLIAHFDPKHPSIDQSLLNTRSQEAQIYRKSLLNGRWGVIIATGFELTKKPQYLNLVAGDGGYSRLFVVEDPKNALCEALVKDSGGRIVHVPIDLSSRDSLVKDVVAAIETSVLLEAAKWSAEGRLPNQMGNDTEGWISSIFTIWDDAVCLASRVQSYFGCIGDRPAVVDICHDKQLARIKLEQAGLAGPRNVRIADLAQAKALGNNLTYPVVLKPINGAASIGIYIIDSYEELVEKFESCQNAMRDIYASEELMGLVFDDAPIDAAKGKSDLYHFVAEEFIGGKEYDCDMVLDNGEVMYANINEDWDFKQGWMCERGMHHPASLNSTDYRYLWEAAAKCAKIIGCTNGVFHVEMKWDPKLGPQMIECNPRMGGAAVWQLHKNVWDVDLLLEASFVFTGIPSRPVLLDQPRGTAVSLILFSDQGGELREDLQGYNEQRIVDMYKKLDEGGIVDYISLPMKKGEVVNGWQDDLYPSHIGRLDLFFPAAKYSPDESIRLGKALRQHVKIPLTSGDVMDES